MTNYDDLLNAARIEAEAYRLAVSKYHSERHIPRMYEALCRENPNFSPKDAIHKIQNDCADMWSKNTILHALSDEIINQDEQNVGRLRQKEHSSAAFSASPTQQKEKNKILVAAVQGKSVSTNIDNHNDNGDSDDADDINLHNKDEIEQGPNKEVADQNTTFEDYAEYGPLCLENDELRQAVRRKIPIPTADKNSATEIVLKILNPKYEEVKAAMESSRDSVYLTFDKSGILQRADPDMLKEGN